MIPPNEMDTDTSTKIPKPSEPLSKKRERDSEMDDIDDTTDKIDRVSDPKSSLQDDPDTTIPTVKLEKPNNDKDDKDDKNDDDLSTRPKPDAIMSNVHVKKEEYVFSPELLAMYYSRLFPFDLLYSWLCYDPTQPPTTALSSKQRHNPTQTTKTPSVFSKREFSFTIEKTPGEEIYIRYKSFPSKKEWESSILKLRPHKIDIGAVYNHPPKDKDAYQGFKPTQRELVFDIDLTDYDNVRHCGCKNAQICHKCWTFMTMAICVIQRGLTDDFGFRHIVWFYSGRRGVHAWICDPNARLLTNDARSAIASYFEIMVDTDKNKDSMNLMTPLHPLFARSFDILEPYFIKHCLPASGHGLLAHPESWEALLSTMPDAAQKVVDKMMSSWEATESSPVDKWQQLKHTIDVFLRVNKKTVKQAKTAKQAKHISFADLQKIETWKYRTVFTNTYPRLDVNVSKMRNHLLKSPFCVHPKTGRVCVPIDIQRLEEFDPFEVPTLPQLMRELDAYAKQEKQDEDIEMMDKNPKKKLWDWQKTSLNTSFEYFRKTFLIPMQKELRKDHRDIKEEQGAYVGDF